MTEGERADAVREEVALIVVRAEPPFLDLSGDNTCATFMNGKAISR